MIRIFSHGFFNVNEIQHIIQAKQSNISHHLKILQEADLVSNKKEGSIIYYMLNEIDKNDSKNKIIDFIKQEEKNISFYEEDSKRMESILDERKIRAEEFFNKIGPTFDSIQDELFKNIYSIEDVFSSFNLKFKSILDLGCGTGRNLPVLAKFAKKVIGVDSSFSMIKLAEHLCKTNHLNYELKLGDVKKLPYSEESIDCVFLNMVLHHFSNPQEALSELTKIIAPKGKLILIDLISHKNDYMQKKYADLWLGFTVEEINKWLKSSNITLKELTIKEDQSKKSDFKVIILLGEKNPV
jgi:ArsR family transcriptional regulator